MTEAERQMRRGLSALLLEAPVEVVRDLSARVQAREDELRSALRTLLINYSAALPEDKKDQRSIQKARHALGDAVEQEATER